MTNPRKHYRNMKRRALHSRRAVYLREHVFIGYDGTLHVGNWRSFHVERMRHVREMIVMYAKYPFKHWTHDDYPQKKQDKINNIKHYLRRTAYHREQGQQHDASTSARNT